MCWYLNETNTDVITVADVKRGDIITFGLEGAHGVKVAGVSTTNPQTGRRTVTYSHARYALPADRKIRRLKFNTDGTVMNATNR